MSDTFTTDDTPQEDPEALAAELDLGLDLSDEERIEAEAMVAHLQAQFGVDVTAENGDAVDPEPEPEPITEPEVAEPEPAEPEEPEPAPEPTPAVDAELSQLRQLRDYLNANPEKAQQVRAVIEGQAAAPEPPKAPEWLDPDDPAQVAMWQNQVALQAAVARLGQTQEAIELRARKAQIQSDVDMGVGAFRTSHPELTENDIDKIRNHSGVLNIVDALRETMSGPDACLKALDIAYRDHPEFQARAAGVPTKAEARKAETKERTSKLSALSGTSGSAPRQETVKKPSTDREARDAAVQWLTEQNIL